MRRFIIIVCILVALGGGLLYAVYYEGFYLDLHPGAPVSADFRTLGGEIQHLADGRWETLEIRGVDVSSSLPGEPAMDFAAGSEDYLRWFESIAALGANTVRVYTIMDSDFYEAFYQFNTESGSTLYLLQGLQVSDAANYGAADAYDSWMSSTGAGTSPLGTPAAPASTAGMCPPGCWAIWWAANGTAATSPIPTTALCTPCPMRGPILPLCPRPTALRS